MKFIKIFIFLLAAILLAPSALREEQQAIQFFDFAPVYIKVDKKNVKKYKGKIKFYNFDDLLIDGQYKKPQVLYTDSRQKVKFGKLLKLKKDFLPKLKNTSKDPTLR
jgi:hypothetical protein